MKASGIGQLRPRLVVEGATSAIEYYKEVFGAEAIERFEDESGRIVHAELAIGSGRLTLKDEDDMDPAPATLGGSPVPAVVDDVDALGERMVARAGRWSSRSETTRTAVGVGSSIRSGMRG
jgi:uncharacterized glyoxalase superfamily protein PhnB